MSRDDAYIEAILASPQDADLRLVYADWLEERGDPRGELVRVEVEMRRVPIHSDRYWQLKPRRNTLRGQADTEWLEKMGCGTDYEPVFRNVPDGWKGRWRLLREFTERWYGIPMPDVGGRAEHIREVERTLDVKLPASVREWIAFGLDLSDQSRFGSVLRDSHDVAVLQDPSAVSLLTLCEGDFCWAVKTENLGVSDPPVHGYFVDCEEGEGETFVECGQDPFAPHVTTFVFRHMSLHGHGGGFATGVDPTESLHRHLANSFPVWSQFDNLAIFEATNMIVMLGTSPYAGNEPCLEVEVWKRIPSTQVPDVLWEYTRNGGSFHGMFVPSEHG